MTPDSAAQQADVHDKLKKDVAKPEAQKTALENQVGAGVLTPRTGLGPLPDNLHFSSILPEEELKTNTVVGAMVPANQTEGGAGSNSENERTLHPFTFMHKDSEALSQATTNLQADASDPAKFRADELNITSDINHLSFELKEVRDRHLANDPNYQKDLQAASTELDQVTSEWQTIEHSDASSSDLRQFASSEQNLSQAIEKLTQPALDHGPTAVEPPPPPPNPAPDKGTTGSDNMILGVQNLKSLEEAEASGMKFGSIRLWDDGVKINQLDNADGTKNQNAWNTLAALTENAHANGKSVMYTFGQARNSDNVCPPPPTDAQITALTEQLTKWSAEQKAEGKGGIDTYELWNEPNGKGFWTGSPQELAHINGIMAKIIRQNDPTAKIASPAVSFMSANATSWDTQYLTAYKAEYGLNSTTFDQIDFHGYGNAGTSPEQIQTDINQMRQLETTFGLQGKPLVDSEDSFGKDSSLPNTQQQENYLARKEIIEEFNGITPGWYAIGNDAWGGMSQPNQLTAAESTVYNWMDGATLEKLNHTGDIYTATLLRDGKQEEIAWTTASSAQQFDPGSDYADYQTLSGGQGLIHGTIELSGTPILLD